MKRGDVYSVSGGGDYLGKPRPAVVLQSHSLDDLSSITICAFTTDVEEVRPFRPPVKRSPGNGLHKDSCIMVDKISTVRKDRIGERIGELDDEDIARLERAVIVFLGLKK